MKPFEDRHDAGRYLAHALGHLADREHLIVLALPRGGVPIGVEVARALRAPLDVLVVRKIGVPDQPELAMGAIARDGIEVRSEELIRHLAVPDAVFSEISLRERCELERRERTYRQGRRPVNVTGQHVVLVDDGLATGASMRAAVAVLERLAAVSVVIGVPVAPPDACAEFRFLVDEVVCPETPEPFSGVGRWYERFDQVSDEDVRDMLARARTAAAMPHIMRSARVRV